MKTKEITLTLSKESFTLLKRPFGIKEQFDISSIITLRNLLTQEKSRLLHVVKHQQPTSLYDLAKKLNRRYPAVLRDVRVLERFGFITLVEEKRKGRKLLKPVLAIESMKMTLQI